jgi:hypothetical protein
MKTGRKQIAIALACLVAVFISYSVFSAATKGRPVISDGEYAKAWVSCQNLMSAHNYYHGVNHNLEELDALWVKEDGAYAKTATFSQPGGVWEGIDLIKVFYGNPNTKNKTQNLKEMVKNEPSAFPVGSMGIHLNTTPIIEVAGDGKTAKGIWYSPGPIFSYTGQKDKDGNDLAGGSVFFEKYGVDFVKEDGEWKIWHIQMYYDYVFSLGSDWTKPGARGAGGPGGGGTPGGAPGGGSGAPGGEQSGAPAGGQRGDQAGGQRSGAPSGGGMPQQVQATRANPNPYAQWSPTRVSTMEPKLPVPYYTFSETFSY